MATPAGIEPATVRLEGGCSIRLSYGAVLMTVSDIIIPDYRKFLEDYFLPLLPVLASTVSALPLVLAPEPGAASSGRYLKLST